jgi:hypothetical protein
MRLNTSQLVLLQLELEANWSTLLRCAQAAGKKLSKPPANWCPSFAPRVQAKAMRRPAASLSADFSRLRASAH